jgi:hypothetical protein
MKMISYKVQGSARDPYSIVIKKNDNKIQCLCNCNAGRKKMHCKHWMSVFEGKIQAYIGISKEQLDEVRSWLTGSDIEQAWSDHLRILEKEDELKKQIAVEKKKIMKKLQKTMLDI